MPKNTFTQDDHRIAFEHYYKSKNWSEASEIIGCAYQTVFNWSRPDFKCSYGCPWHNWDMLIKERDSAVRDIAQHIEKDYVTELLDVANNQHLTGKASVRKKMLSLMRSDIERIQHWEVLYAKIFYDMTNIEISTVPGIDIDAARKALGTVVRGGMHVTSMKDGVYLLATILKEIEGLKYRAGLVSEKGQTISEEEAIEQEAETPVTLEELRNLRQHLEHTSPEQIDALSSILRSEETTLSQVQNVSNAGR